MMYHNKSAKEPPREPLRKTAQALTMASPALQTLNLEGIDLIIRWFTTTVHTVVPDGNPSALEVVQTVILRQAMAHHFLLHGLLSFSALHRAHLQSNPSEKVKYTQITNTHHTQGLALYHSILVDINESNYAASIAFSSLTTMFAFGVSRPGEDAGMEIVDDLTQIFLLAQGWGKVVLVADKLDRTAAITRILGIASESACALDDDTERTFSRLHELNRTYSRECDVELYTLAIDSLKSVFGVLAGVESVPDPHVSMAWMGVLPEKCIRLFRERQDLALVLLVYHCLVLNRVPKVWWLDGWSPGLLEVIRRNVGPGYRDELK
jgi:hypothetical protein